MSQSKSNCISEKIRITHNCYYAQYFGGFGGLRIRRIKRQNEKISLNNRFSQNVLITPQKRSDPGGPARDGNGIMKNPGFEDRDKQGG